MKNNNLKVAVLGTFILSIFSACDKRESGISQENSIRNEISFQSGTQEHLSEFALKSGISRLEAAKDGNSIVYTSQVASTALLNRENVDFSELTFILKDNKLTIDDIYSLSLKSEGLYLETPLYSGYMKDGRDNNVIDSKTAALMLIYAEISKDSKDIEKMSYSDFVGKDNSTSSPIKIAKKDNDTPPLIDNRQCGLNHAVQVGWSAESTSADLADQLSNTDFYNGCSKVGGISTSCVADQHICLSSQTFRCPC